MDFKFWSLSGSGYAARLRPEEWENVRGRITECVRADLQNREVLALLFEEYGLRIRYGDDTTSSRVLPTNNSTSERQLKNKAKEWSLQGRRARRAGGRNAVETGPSQLLEEAGISHRVSNPALHSFSQTPLSQMNLEGPPSLNTIFNQGHERLGFDGPRGNLCMSRAPLHQLERYQSQVWPLEAMNRRLRKMQQFIQKPQMGLHDILLAIELCTGLWLIGIFIKENDAAMTAHRSGFTTLLTLLCAKAGMFTRPTNMVFGSVETMINYWAMGWPRRKPEDTQHRYAGNRKRTPSPFITRFVATL